MIFFDFEVFAHDWLVVFADMERHEETVIVNDREKLEAFHRANKNRIFAGYNVRNYDQWVFKAILCGFDPKRVNDWIILKGRKGWEFSSQLRKIPLTIYDCFQNIDRGLKYFEGSLGHDIRETGVSFDIDRPLTEAEIAETVKYCRHDVEQTVEVFLHRKADFDAQMGLLKMFDLPLQDLGKTKPQLSAKVLGARRKEHKDEFEIDLPPTLRVERYRHIVAWYEDPANRKYRVDPDNEKSAKHNLKCDVAGVPHVFGWGGLHGAREKYHAKGYFVNMDVASLYPSLMIRYDLMSRNVPDPAKFEEIYRTRLKYKAEKNPLQAPLKLVLNSTYGAMKDKFNPLYDPLQANRVCVYGQLLLLDLMERLEDAGAEIIQSNTDGVLARMPDGYQGGEDAFFDAVDDVAHEWEQRTGLNLEFDEYTEVFQKDVNNYVFKALDGGVKTKGGYVKKQGALDRDLPVVNRALVEHMAHGVPVEQTIMNARSLADFQLVARLSSKYSTFVHGDESDLGRTCRVFASKDERDPGLCKIHAATGRPAKVASTPQRCFIVNDDISGREVPPKLDKGWYASLAYKRLADFGIS